MGQPAVAHKRGSEDEAPESLTPARRRPKKSTPKEAFGVSVRMARCYHRLSIDDVFWATRVDRKIIEQIEAGKNSGASVRDVEKIAKALYQRLSIQQIQNYTERTKMETVFTRGGRLRLKPIVPRRS